MNHKFRMSAMDVQRFSKTLGLLMVLHSAGKKIQNRIGIELLCRIILLWTLYTSFSSYSQRRWWLVDESTNWGPGDGGVPGSAALLFHPPAPNPSHLHACGVDPGPRTGCHSFVPLHEPEQQPAVPIKSQPGPALPPGGQPPKPWHLAQDQQRDLEG